MAMQTIKIPKDIKRYVLIRVLARVTVCALLLAAVITGVTMNLDAILEKGTSYAVIMYALPSLIVLIVTGVPVKLIDSTWCGEVVEHKTKTVIQSKMNGANYKTGFDGYGSKMSEYRHVLTVIVKLQNGMKVSFTACDTTDADIFESFISDYRVGTRVLHVYGTKYLQVISDSDVVKCVICGEENEKSDRVCDKCKHSILLTEDVGENYGS